MSLLAVIPSKLCAQGQSGPQLWRRLGRAPQNRPAAERWVTPDKFDAVTLDHAAMRAELSHAPMESVPGFIGDGLELALPMPDGGEQHFRVVESSVMAPELAAKFPEIKTYVGQGIDDPMANVRLDLTPAGFHAQILSPHGAVYIDPHFRDKSVYASYYKRDYRRVASDFRCLTAAGQTITVGSSPLTTLNRSGANLRTYRLACAADAEYTAFHGGTVSAGLSAVVTAINRVTGVYETELAIRLVLVANNNLIIYTSSGTDPYSNTSGSTMLNQNQSTLDSVIGNANYDIGHVFSTGGGGIASLGVVCQASVKARGVTGNPSPVGDSFWIDYVAHEMGHEFGANHTFNSSAGSCGGANRNASTAYEPGSGSTIMAYAGICGTDDLQPHSDPYFHSISFDEILSYTTSGSGSTCPVVTSTGNSAPTVNAGANYTIPARTPFILTASGSDTDGDALTYCWEERDLGASITLTTADNGSSPLFRVFNPTTNTWRTFPKLSDILNNTTSLGEMLPTTSRTMSFRVTARDNRAGGGGVNTDDMSVTVVSSAGPFTVTSQTSGGTFSNNITVTWNVANTTASPISAANVSISLSTNGGQTFPITLVASTPNDGSQSVLLPNINTSQARLKVQGVANVFFDVNPANFSIVPGVPSPQVTLDSVTLSLEGCGSGNGAIDPGETVTVLVGLRNTGSANTTNLVATLLASGGVTVPSIPQNYGVLVAGGATVTLPFTFTATGSCGGSLAMGLSLQDGPANLGTVTQASVLGGFSGATASFTNGATIATPNAGTKGKASVYPSVISVSGITGSVSQVQLTLLGLTHSWVGDLDFLLVGPAGQKVLFMSDAGDNDTVDDGVSGITLTFSDDAVSSLPDTAPVSSGTYLPTNISPSGDSDAFSSPAPVGPYATALSAFNGSNPNGTWSLYIMDDANMDTGDLAGGWVLTISTLQPNCCGAVTNNPPNLPPITNKQIAELQTLTFTNSATDPDGNSLLYSLVGAPGNAAIGATSGVFTWTPTEVQGPATNVMQVVVTDNGLPSLSVTQTCTIVVLESNLPPSLAPIASRVVHAGITISFTNSATDPDWPANLLDFTLDPGAPAGAVVSTDGVFAWPTSDANANTTNQFTVRVSDNGVPVRDSAQSFSITVESRPLITSIVASNNLVALTWSAISGETYRVQRTPDLAPANWTDVPGDVVAAGSTASRTNALDLNSHFYRVRWLNP